MNNFKIGDSDELVTVTRTKWDEINGEISDLQGQIVEITAGNSYVSVQRYRGHDGIEEYWDIMTNDKALVKLKDKINEMSKENLESSSNVKTLKSKLRWLKTRSRWYMFRYYRSVQRQIERSL